MSNVSRYWSSTVAGRTLAVIVVTAAVVLPLLDGNSARVLSYSELVILIIVAVALNIAMGFAGQMILGIPAVFAIGGYASAILLREVELAGWLPVMVGVGVVAGLCGGLLIGLPALRIGDFYLAMISIYAALAVPVLASRFEWLGGEVGFLLFLEENFNPALSELGGYYAALTLLLLAVLLSWAIKSSAQGRRFAVLQESRELTKALGFSVYRQQLIAIAIASALAGGAGGLYAYTQQFVGPTISSAHMAILLVATVAIGGTGTVLGPVVGGALVLGLSTFLTGLDSYNDAVFGVILLACAVFLPGGLVATMRRAYGPRVCVVDDVSPPRPAAADDVELPQRTSEDVVLSIRGASRSFGAVKAVNEMGMTVHAGEIHGLIGSNGSGKTTLLNLICGFYRLDEGAISVLGVSTTRLSVEAIARTGVARTFQTPKLVSGESVLNNVLVAMESHRTTSAIASALRLRGARRLTNRRVREVTEILDSMGIGHVLHSRAGDLPHGTQRLVEVARVLAAQSSLVLVDEPAAGLTSHEVAVLATSLRTMAARGAAVVLIEHNVPFVLDLASEVTAMHQGELLFRGTPDELRENATVADAFLGGLALADGREGHA